MGSESMEDKTILLVEDDPSHATLIRRAIEQIECHCTIDTAADGTEVIDYLFARGSHAGRDATKAPDLILLDLKMPKMNGLELLQVLKRVRYYGHVRLPPVVVLTSSKQETDILKAYQLGADGYVEKPTNFDAFVEALRQIVNYWLGVNTSPPTRTVK